MPLSLKCKLSKLRHNGQITDDEYNELIKKLDGHDKKIRADERTKVFDEISAYIINSCKDVKCKEDITIDNDFDFYASELLESLEVLKEKNNERI